MNVTNESDNASTEADPKRVATSRTSNRNTKRALAAVSEYVSRILAASLLTMWGALNLIISLRSALFSPDSLVANEPAGTGWITLVFVAVTALLPFLIGLHLFRKLFQQTKVR